MNQQQIINWADIAKLEAMTREYLDMCPLDINLEQQVAFECDVAHHIVMAGFQHSDKVVAEVSVELAEAKYYDFFSTQLT